MDIMYKTTAVSTKGRSGKVVVNNSPLEFTMTPPVEMGGSHEAQKNGVNPEQLLQQGMLRASEVLYNMLSEKKSCLFQLPVLRQRLVLAKTKVAALN